MTFGTFHLSTRQEDIKTTVLRVTSSVYEHRLDVEILVPHAEALKGRGVHWSSSTLRGSNFPFPFLGRTDTYAIFPKIL